MFTFSTTFIFGEYIFGAILEAFAFCGFGYLLWQSQRKGNANALQISSSMTLYASCCLLQSFFGFIHLTYLALFWQKDTVTYNAYFLFITGTLSVMFLLTVALCVNFLSIDRMLILMFPIKYSNRIKKITLITAIIIIVIIDIIVTVFDMAIDYPTTAETKCRAHACLRVNSQAALYTNARYCISAVNVVTGILLGILVKKHSNGNSATKKANRVIVITMLLSFIFDFIPHIATFFVFRNSISQIQGPHSLIFGTIDVASCALLYCKNLLKPFEKQMLFVSSSNRISSTRNNI